MKTRIIHYLAAIALLYLNSSRALAQKPLRDLFTNRQVVAEERINTPMIRIRNLKVSKRYVSLFGYRDPKTLLSDVFLYNTDGNLAWEKQLRYVKNIVLADESDKVIVLYDIGRYGEKGHNACFDGAGNKLWEMPVTVPGITAISPDGKYAITTVSGGEGFKVFDLETGWELETPISPDYTSFRARFLNEKQVIVTTMKVDVARDQEALERYRQMRGKGGWKRGDPAPHTLKYTLHPALFIVYDIPSRTILSQRELFTPDGESLYLVSHRAAPHISIAPDGQRVAMVMYKTIESPPYVKDIPTLVQVDLQGNVEWENDNFTYGYLNGIFEVGNGTILINEPPRTFHLVDRSGGNKLWTYKSEQSASEDVRDLFIQDNRLVLQTADDRNARIHTLDLATGALLQNTDYSNEEILLLTGTTSIVVYNIAQKQLQFIR